jgi:hypothetical protein
MDKTQGTSQLLDKAFLMLHAAKKSPLMMRTAKRTIVIEH